MLKITSLNNQKIKEILKLKQKKFREEKKLFLIESYKVFLEAEKVNLKIKELFVEEKFANIINKKYEHITTLIDEKVSNKLSNFVSSCGFFAVIEKPKIKMINNENFLILDNIQDPLNLGAIIRTSVATNIKNIYCLNCVDEFNDKTIRASMGNVFKVNIIHTKLEDLKVICKNKEIFAADMNGENLFLTNKPKNNFGVILGNEGNGVCEEVKMLANKTISIPMQNDVESLNVSVSAGIILYYLTT